MIAEQYEDIINHDKIIKSLDIKNPEVNAVRDILQKAKSTNGLSLDDIPVLAKISDPELLNDLFSTANEVKEKIYGKRLVLFTPLYISNLCKNECLYCAFRASNKEVTRKVLSQTEIEEQVKILIEQGHKRVLMVAGESYPNEGFDYIIKSINTIYSTHTPKGNIRRVNVNIAPLSIEEFQELLKCKIGTYQLFQETYHKETYSKMHLKGKKSDINWRVTAIDRAMKVGIPDVGIGVLFGLFDWRYEVLALIQHIRHLEKEYGIGPHTISVPRLEPAINSSIASSPPYPVSDIDFRKIVAILRLAVPYTGIIMSTRENPNIRRDTFALGVSQISAGSRTNPGGYSKDEENNHGDQFSLGDHRSLDEVIRDITSLGYIPSFCTGCYRLGRVGKDFMDLAKPGEIKAHCDPNALSTFQEYLEDFASPSTKSIGEKSIENALSIMEEGPRTHAMKLIKLVKDGKRDVYC